MDPNETLALMRGAVRAYISGEHHANVDRSAASRQSARERMAEAADSLVTHAAAIDRWLSHGGSLPDAWRER